MPMNNPSAVQGAGIRLGIPAALERPQRAMASPPTVTTSTVASQISGGRVYPMWRTGNSSFPYVGASVLSSVTPAAGAQVIGPITVNAAGTTFTNQSFRYVMNFDGTTLEFQNQSAGGAYWIKINDEYIDPAGTTLAADATNRWIKITFAARTQCKIEWFGYGLDVSAIFVDATAGLYPAPIRGKRIIMLGDSFFGSSSTPSRVVADMLGWNDVWNNGMGGTGVVSTNGGANQSYEQRFAHDVLGYTPDIAWVVGSVNDDAATPADVSAAILRMRNAYIAAKPQGLFVWSPNASNGPGQWTINKNRIRWGITAALAGLQNTLVVDTLEQPTYTQNVLPAATLQTASIIGATSLKVFGQALQGGFPQIGGCIRIDDEVFEVKDCAFGGTSGGNYLFTVTIDGTAKAAHAAGAAWTTVGAPYITGTGSAGNPSGYGSSDVYRISNADIHATFAGAVAMGIALANGLQRATYA